MIRTQIYLTDVERKGIEGLAKSTGRKQAELIREAIDRFLDMRCGREQKHILDQAAGMWAKREDLPDFSAVRESWDRGASHE